MAVVYCHLDHCHDDDDDDDDEEEEEEEDKNDDKDDDDDFHYCDGKHNSLFKNIMTSHVYQGGTTCGAIEESSRSLKSIDKRVFINFRDKYAVFTNFRDKNAVVTSFCDKNYTF